MRWASKARSGAIVEFHNVECVCARVASMPGGVCGVWVVPSVGQWHGKARLFWWRSDRPALQGPTEALHPSVEARYAAATGLPVRPSS